MVVEKEFRNFEKCSAIKKLRQCSSSKIYLVKAKIFLFLNILAIMRFLLVAQELGPKGDCVVLKPQVLPIDFYKHKKHDLFKKLHAFYGIFDKIASNFNENFKLEFLVKFLIYPNLPFLHLFHPLFLISMQGKLK